MGQGRLLLKIFLKGILGFIIFIVLLGLLNLVNFYFSQPLLNSTVLFLNQSVVWIILFAVLFLFGELFLALDFPFNLPSPLFNAVASVFLVKFIFNVLNLVNDNLNMSEVISFDWLYGLIATLVFVLVIIVGYIKILSNVNRKNGLNRARRR